MKTTIEIPDATFKRAKAAAASRRVPLRQFVSEAVEEKLKKPEMTPAERRAMLERAARPLRRLRQETARIAKLIEEEFEAIEPEDWE